MSSQKLKITLDNSTRNSIQSNLDNLILSIPFLINLTPSDIKKSLKMGSNSFVYAQKVLLLARINPDTIAPSIDLIQFEQDLALIKDLNAIQSKLNVLQEGIKDTLMALGAQTLKTANICYGMMKEVNKATHALDETLGPILASKKHKRRKETEII